MSIVFQNFLYTVSHITFVLAHTTQFTKVGWHYLSHGAGVGHLDKGGSYISMINDDSSQLTIVIETMVSVKGNIVTV